MPESKTTKTTTLAGQFLQEALDTRQTVSLYLVNGFQLKGLVLAFDEETILFRHKNVGQHVLRSAVATMYFLPSPKRGPDERGAGRQSTAGGNQ